MVEGDFAPGDPATPWNLRDRLAALGSSRIGPVSLCSCLAPLSCWPRLPPEFETYFVNGLGLAQYSGAADSGAGVRKPPRERRGYCIHRC